MIDIDRERRDGERVALSRPCKVYEPRSRKYLSGSTCNVSPGGMLLRLDRPLDLEAGDRLFVGVSQRRRQVILRTADLVEARITRLLPMTSGETVVAVQFACREESLLPTRRAA